MAPEEHAGTEAQEFHLDKEEEFLSCPVTEHRTETREDLKSPSLEMLQAYLDTILVTAPGDPLEQGGGTGGAPVVLSSLKLSVTLCYSSSSKEQRVVNHPNSSSGQ